MILISFIMMPIPVWVGALVIGVIGSLIVTAGWEGTTWLCGAVGGSNQIEDLLETLCRTHPDRVRREGGMYSVVLVPSDSPTEWATDGAFIYCDATSIEVTLVRNHEVIMHREEMSRDDIMDLLRQHRLALLEQVSDATAQRLA